MSPLEAVLHGVDALVHPQRGRHEEGDNCRDADNDDPLDPIAGGGKRFSTAKPRGHGGFVVFDGLAVGALLAVGCRCLVGGRFVRRLVGRCRGFGCRVDVCISLGRNLE